MLEVGNLGDGPLAFAESRTHFGAWCVVSSPLLLSTALADDATMDAIWPIVSNTEAIAVNQAWAGHPGRIVAEGGGGGGGAAWQAWAKPVSLSDGAQAVLVLNAGDAPVNASLPLARLNLSTTTPCGARDVWARADLADVDGSWDVRDLGPHDSRFVVLTPKTKTKTQQTQMVEEEASPAAVSAVVEEEAATAATAPAGLGVAVSAKDGSYTISVDGEEWLRSGPTFFTVAGRRYSTDDGSLALVGGAVRRVSGSDAQLGAYEGWEATWRAASVEMVTTIRRHAGDATLSFETRFPDGVEATGARAADWGELLTSFPSLMMAPKPGAAAAASAASSAAAASAAAAPSLGYLTFSGRFIEASRAGAWDGPGGGDLPSGAGAGPFALFDASAAVALMVSPLDTFMATSFNPEPTQAGGGGKAYACGLIGSLASLPAGHATRFVMSLGGRAGGPLPGIGGAVKQWGELMLRAYAKDAAATRAADMTLSRLGYSTDNGAFYYRGPERGKTYEQTLLDVHAYAESAHIPYAYVLLDSWWYYKGEGGGVKTWAPRPDIFPSGLEAFVKATGWKTQLHNRYWANDTTYATQNGGAYDFVVEAANSLALPTSQRFWDDLLANASARYGMVVYEQDWLYNEFNGLNATRQRLGLARDWLVQMGRGAARAGATVQYCMTYARMLLQSVEIGAVSQFRALDDYGPGQSDGCGFPYCVYDIGTTSLFAWALGLAPSKDNWWSTPQPGGAYGVNRTEPFNALQASIAALSTGPVQPSDAVNRSDVPLILTTCTAASGTLLQPSRPAAAIDAALLRAAFGAAAPADGPRAAKPHDTPVWATHTAVGPHRWAHVLAVGLAADFALRPRHLPLDLADAAAPHVAWRSFPSNRTRSAVGAFGAAAPLPLPACNYSDFGLFHVAPVLSVGSTRLALLGEPTKVVPVSVHRVAQLIVDGASEVRAVLRGDAGEKVDLEVAVEAAQPDGSAGWSVRTVSCVVGASGKATASLIAGECA